MATKTITGAYPVGYTLSAAYDRLVATSTAALGEEGGYGVLSKHLATFDNYGMVAGTGTGVGFYAGGTIVNEAGGTISGAYGVEIFGGAGFVENYGKISGRIQLQSGGGVINGSAGDTQAAIADVVISGTLGAITNFGQCGSVNLEAGGTVTNGSAGDLTAKTKSLSIYGGSPGDVTNIGIPGAVTNFGTVNSVAFNDHNAVVNVNANTFTNGSAQDTSAQCGFVRGRYCGITIVNFGTLATANYVRLPEIYVRDSIYLTNGSATDTGALVSGYSGYYARNGTGTVVNFGTIVAIGTQKNAVGIFVRNARVTNGSPADTVARISGYTGIKLAATVMNYGTIIGTGNMKAPVYHEGVDAGVVTNGSMADRTALIEGYYGVLGGVIANYGTIVGNGKWGVYAGAQLTNGAVGDSSALIQGRYGVSSVGTVTNFGTIEGSGGIALQFRLAGQGVLQVEAGSTLIGAVLGDGGTLDLASGKGTLAGLFTPAGTIVAYGAIARTTFTGFGTLEIGSGASFSVAGYGTVAGGDALIVAGTLSSANTIGSAGAITVSGTLAGSGTLRLSGGSMTIDAGGALTIASIAISGGATAVAIDTSLTYAGTLKQTNGTISVGAGDILALTGADTLAGTLAGAGSVTVKTTLTIGPSEVLSGGVELNLSNATSPVVVGASASSRLVNTSGTIHGAGQLGGGLLTLVNKAGGVINGDAANILILNTGATAIYNAGLIKASGAGGVRIKSAITNYGTLQAQASNLTVQGAVTGSGSVRISAGGVVDFTSSFSENVTFAAPTGTLELAQSQAYAATLTGFSKTGGTSLDLADIAFTSGVTKASFSGTTAGGVLTVTDGTHTANVKLTGDFTASTFTVSSDGRGGTWVVDPPASSPPLAQAMAGFQHGPPAHLAATPAYTVPRFPILHAQA